jgi:hypothetical protein
LVSGTAGRCSSGGLTGVALVASLRLAICSGLAAGVAAGGVLAAGFVASLPGVTPAQADSKVESVTMARVFFKGYVLAFKGKLDFTPNQRAARSGRPWICFKKFIADYAISFRTRFSNDA